MHTEPHLCVLIHIMAAEVQSHKELEEDKVSLPLGWFDWLLRNLGTLLPIPAILLRISGSLASLLPTNPAGKLELAAYLAASALRLVVYQLHVSGGPQVLALRTSIAVILPLRALLSFHIGALQL